MHFRSESVQQQEMQKIAQDVVPSRHVIQHLKGGSRGFFHGQVGRIIPPAHSGPVQESPPIVNVPRIPPQEVSGRHS